MDFQKESIINDVEIIWNSIFIFFAQTCMHTPENKEDLYLYSD